MFLKVYVRTQRVYLSILLGQVFCRRLLLSKAPNVQQTVQEDSVYSILKEQK